MTYFKLILIAIFFVSCGDETSAPLSDNPSIQQEESSVTSSDTPSIQQDESLITSSDNLPVQQEEPPVISSDTPVMQEEAPVVSSDNLPVQQEEPPVISSDTPVMQEENPVISSNNPSSIQDENPIVEQNPSLTPQEMMFELQQTNDEFSFDSILGTYKGSANFGWWGLGSNTDYILEVVSGTTSNGHLEFLELIFLFSSEDGILCTSYLNPSTVGSSSVLKMPIIFHLNARSTGQIKRTKYITDMTFSQHYGLDTISLNREWMPDTTTQPQSEPNTPPRSYSEAKEVCSSLAQ